MIEMHEMTIPSEMLERKEPIILVEIPDDMDEEEFYRRFKGLTKKKIVLTGGPPIPLQ